MAENLSLQNFDWDAYESSSKGTLNEELTQNEMELIEINENKTKKCEVENEQSDEVIEIKENKTFIYSIFRNQFTQFELQITDCK